MRLHSLEVRAFGPFPATARVDFDDVCSAGLFLIHGATGSGKTSLLDAICFALFADVPGARTKRGLGSHHAVEGTRPAVILDFSVGGRRFRVERTPEFERPKRRGTGLLRVPASVTLEERSDGAWMPVSTRHDEVAHLLDDVLGMGLAQFAKVVVLPQGDVSAFLRSSPEDRRVLLERLFDISTFTDVETWLAGERKRTAALADELETRLTHDLTRLDDLLGDTAALDWQDVAHSEVPAALNSCAAALNAEVTALLTEADDADRLSERAGATLAQARATAAARARGEAAQRSLDLAATRRDEIESLRERVRAARSAEALVGHLDALDAATAEEAGCGAALTELWTRLGGLGIEPRDPTGLAALATRLDATEPLITEMSHATAQLIRTQDILMDTQGEATAAEAAVVVIAERVTKAAAVLAQRTEQVTHLREVAAGQDAAGHDHARARRALDLVTSIASLVETRDAARPRLIAAQRDLLDAQDALVAIRARQLDGMAAALAGELTDGDPCPVCGSEEHPALAAMSDLVTTEQVDDAQQHHRVATEVVEQLLAQDTALASRIDTLTEQHDPAMSTDVAVLARSVEAADTRLREAVTAGRQLEAAAPGLDAAHAALAAAREDLAAAESRLSAARATLGLASDAHAELADQVSRLRQQHQSECPCAGDDTSTDDLTTVRVHRQVATAVGAAVETQNRCAEADSRRLAAQDSALCAALERGFADLAEARAAHLAPTDLDTLRSAIADHDQAVAVAEATLAEDSIVAALAAPVPDLTTIESVHAAARVRVREAQAAHTRAEERFRSLELIRGSVIAQIVELGGLRARAAAVKELADAVGGTGGGNELRMRLSSFVLAARLEKVVALANERLHTMDSGRYLLEHSDAKVAGNARSGLDLRVLDQWTGRSRETASLSGGESFMVSLALALGLADAVREETGGLDLGTLFIDEGFGSLDEDSLEHVMDVLDGLREGGRAVGVVSHVHDLRSRITHQVMVEKQTTGSTVHVRTAASPAA